VRGGRLTNGAAIIGGLLNIKPILTFKNGTIVLFEKVRSTKKAIRRAIELTKSHFVEDATKSRVFVIHSGNIELAEKIQQDLKQEIGEEVCLSTFGPVIGTHLGSNALGIGITAE
jgi:DegV family protein with EDD domain